MPLQIQNITDEAHQRHVIVFDESEIELTLRFHPTVEMWTFDTVYKTLNADGYKLSVGVLHMRSRNFPFDFVVRDQTDAGLDPFRLDDFSTGRCALYLLDAADMEIVRDAPVPL